MSPISVASFWVLKGSRFNSHRDMRQTLVYGVQEEALSPSPSSLKINKSFCGVFLTPFNDTHVPTEVQNLAQYNVLSVQSYFSFQPHFLELHFIVYIPTIILKFLSMQVGFYLPFICTSYSSQNRKEYYSSNPTPIHSKYLYFL